MADPGFDRQPHPGGDFGAEDLDPLFVFGQFAFVDREPELRERLRVGAEVDLEEAEVAELEQFPGRGIEPLLQSAAPVLRELEEAPPPAAVLAAFAEQPGLGEPRRLGVELGVGDGPEVADARRRPCS